MLRYEASQIASVFRSFAANSYFSCVRAMAALYHISELLKKTTARYTSNESYSLSNIRLWDLSHLLGKVGLEPGEIYDYRANGDARC